MGVRQSVVSRLEHSRNARLDTILSYAQALGLELVVVPRSLVPRLRGLLLDGKGDEKQAPPLIRPRALAPEAERDA
jgi:mRNA degradation ribonuclease J1/J2